MQIMVLTGLVLLLKMTIHAIVVPELPDLLSTVQLQHLSTILEHMANTNSSDEECSWIEQYLESSSYIECCVLTE